MLVEFSFLNFKSIVCLTKLIPAPGFFNQMLERDACSLISLPGEVRASMGLLMELNLWPLWATGTEVWGLLSSWRISKYELNALGAGTQKVLWCWGWPTPLEVVRARDVDGNQVLEATLGACPVQLTKETAEPNGEKMITELQNDRRHKELSRLEE